MNDLLTLQEYQRIFTILDHDRTGVLSGEKIDMMFSAILGFECSGEQALGSAGFKKGCNLNIGAFKKVVQQAHAGYPGWGIKANLKRFLNEHQAKVPEEHDLHDDALSPQNMMRLFKILDQDQSGVLDAMEAYKLFKAAKLPCSILLERLQGTPTLDPEAFGTVIRAIDDAYPEKDVDGKILTFLHEAMHSGKPPSMDAVDLNCPDDHISPPVEDAVGTRKALLIGINYLGSANELGGCINDAKSEYKMLTEHFRFPPEQVMLLTEDQSDASQSPTKVNMLRGIRWLMDGAKRGDVLFFHYSGHGSQVPDESGQEEDGMNECLCPVDCMSNPWPDAVIIDDFLNDTFFDALPDGVRLICVYDCCHSGTMTDLEFHRGVDFTGSMTAADVVAARNTEGANSRFLTPPSHVTNKINSQTRANQPPPKTRAMTHATAQPKQLWTVSGCQDNQTSADATIGGKKQGALTWGLHAALAQKDYNLSYDDLLVLTRKKLKGKYTQIPSMSTTAESNFRCKFLGGVAA